MKHVKYTVVVENAGSNLSVYVPDLPGCVSTGRTVDEAIVHIREAIELHLEGLRQDGIDAPKPSACSVQVEAKIPA